MSAHRPAAPVPLSRNGRPPGVRRRALGTRPWPIGPALLLAVLAASCLVPRRWTDVDLTAFAEPPSAAHWLGTTPTGRDVLALTLIGTRRSLAVGLGAAIGATGLAAAAGTLAGYLGGWADRVLTWATDLLMVFPPFLVAAVLSPVLGGAGWPALAAVLAGLTWTVTARTVRAQARSLRNRPYADAARHAGLPAVVIVVRHVAPHLGGLLAADAALNAGAAVVAETGLSFLGVGVRPPDVSLGTLIADAAPAATVLPWPFLPPVAALITIMLAVDRAGAAFRRRPHAALGEPA